MALVPLNLFITHDGKSKRQHVTCRYKCGDACSKPVRNTSDNEYFGDIAKAVSRRSVLQAGGIAVLAVGAGSALAACGNGRQPVAAPTSSTEPPADAARHEVHRRRAEQRGRRGHPRRLSAERGDPLGRTGIGRRAEVRHHKSDRCRAARSVRLQQRLRRAAADPGRFRCQPNRFLLVTNFEYVDPVFMFPGYNAAAPSREQFDVEIAAVGMGVLEVERIPGGGLRPVMGRYNRRITADTPMTLTGPAAGTDFVKTPRRSCRSHRSGHLRQLRRRRHPMGHSAFRRGELSELLRRDEGRGAAKPAGRRPDGSLRRRAGALRSAVGDLRPPLRCGQDAQRGQPLRLHRRTEPVGSELGADQTQCDGPVQTRGRQHPHHRRRHRRGLQRRRRTLRLHVQVRVEQEDAARQGSRGPREQHDPARRGHAVCRQALQRHPGRRDRRLRQAAGQGLLRRGRAVAPAAAVRPGRSGRIAGRRA